MCWGEKNNFVNPTLHFNRSAVSQMTTVDNRKLKNKKKWQCSTNFCKIRSALYIVTYWIITEFSEQDSAEPQRSTKHRLGLRKKSWEKNT